MCWSLFSEPNETTFMGTTLSLALFMNGKGNFLGETSQRLSTIDDRHLSRSLVSCFVYLLSEDNFKCL